MIIDTSDLPIVTRDVKNHHTLLRLLIERLTNTVTHNVPTTGFEITISDGITSLVLEPVGTLATGTINMPANPFNGQTVSISSTQIVISLTLAGNGATIVGNTTALAVNTAVEYKYIEATDKWYKQK